MRLFRRRTTGRHALGAAVTSIPSRPPAVAPVLPAPVVPAPVLGSARGSLETALAQLLPEQAAPATTVQLGFRDGSSATLDPESEQALALELLAQSLTRRD